MDDKRIIKDFGNGAQLTACPSGEMTLTVPEGFVMEKPIILTNMLTAEDLVEQRHTLHVTMHAGSRVDLAVIDRSSDIRPYDIRRAIILEVEEGASLNFCLSEEMGAEATCANTVTTAVGGSLTMGLFSMGNGAVTNDLRVDFTADHASADLFGAAILTGQRKVTDRLTLEHRFRHCTDRELFKFILDDESEGHYEGLVRVCPGATGADSCQLNRNICLSRAARMFAQPQLIIDHDDVRCSHGATVGQLDEDALFYMQQRGISRHEARLLLLSSFLSEVIGKVPVSSLQDRLRQLAESRLRGELNHCVACGACKN